MLISHWSNESFDLLGYLYALYLPIWNYWSVLGSIEVQVLRIYTMGIDLRLIRRLTGMAKEITSQEREPRAA